MENRTPEKLKVDLQKVLQERQKQKKITESEIEPVIPTSSSEESFYSHSINSDPVTSEKETSILNESSKAKYEQLSYGIHQDVIEYERIYDRFSDLYRNYNFVSEQIQSSMKEIDSYAGAFVSASKDAKEELSQLPAMINALSEIQKKLSSVVEKLSSEEFYEIAEVIVEASIRFQNIGSEVLRELAVMKAERDEIKNEIKSLRILIEEHLLSKDVEVR